MAEIETKQEQNISETDPRNRLADQGSWSNSLGKHAQRSNGLSFIWETVKIIIVSLAIIVPIRYFIVQPFFVKGASMESSFADGDYILIDEITYRFRNPDRGEVVVFRFPEDHSQFFIKRIIGLPNETL
ncbi:MAG: signal peptidase I [Candidatus Yanofskybacteria bacterium]|nr:signal peptidase I [Candidatus Yanofskybacteria bacterium]